MFYKIKSLIHKSMWACILYTYILTSVLCVSAYYSNCIYLFNQHENKTVYFLCTLGVVRALLLSSRSQLFLRFCISIVTRNPMVISFKFNAHFRSVSISVIHNKVCWIHFSSQVFFARRNQTISFGTRTAAILIRWGPQAIEQQHALVNTMTIKWCYTISIHYIQLIIFKNQSVHAATMDNGDFHCVPF